MGRFPTAGHLSSWAGLCPRQQRERRQASHAAGRTQGNRWLRTALVQAAWAAVAGQGDVPGGAVPADGREPGQKRAAVAVGHTILVIVYHLLKEGTTYGSWGRTTTTG